MSNRIVASGDVLKGRRQAAKNVVVEIFGECGEAMHLGGVVKRWEAKTGLKHDRISWYDVLHAIEDLAKEGSVAVDTSGKRVQYKAIPKEDDKQLTLDL